MMPLVDVHIYVFPHQKLWIKTLSERTKLSQAKLIRILTCQFMLWTDGIKGEERQETLSKRNGISREKLDELDCVKNLLRKKRKDQKDRIQYLLPTLEKDFSPKSRSEHVRILIEIDMLDLKSKEDILAKLKMKRMDSKLKHLKENDKVFENTLPMLRNKQGA